MGSVECVCEREMAEDLKVEETELRCEMTKMVIEIFSFWLVVRFY